MHQHEHRRHRQHHHQAETEQADTAEEQHRRRSAHHHDGGAEVRLHQQQTSHGQQHDERLEEAHPAFTNFLLTANQITAKENHHEHLGDFRGLNVENTEADPAHRTVDLAANPRQQHHDQQTEGADQHQPAQTLPGGNRNHHRRATGEQAQHHVEQVTNHHVQRVAGLHGSHFRRCGRDHHQAQAQQGETTGEHRKVDVDATATDQRRRIRLDHPENHDKASTAWANRRPRSS